MRASSSVEVELLDRSSDYMEVVPIRHRPETVLRRIQELLLATSEPSFRSFDVSARIACTSFVLEFSAGDHQAAERFATLLAMSLGWKLEDGVILGRCS